MLAFVRRNIAFEKRGKIHVACKERNKKSHNNGRGVFI